MDTCNNCSRSTEECPRCGNEQFCKDCNECNICGPKPRERKRREAAERAAKRLRIVKGAL